MSKRVKKYAEVAWTAEDVLKCKPEWTEAQAEAWLLANANTIQELMIQDGWDYIEDELGSMEDPLDD